MQDPAAHDTAPPAPYAGTRRGSLVGRALVAVAVIAAVVWGVKYLSSRGERRSEAGGGTAAATDTRGQGAASRSRDRGGQDGRVVTVQVENVERKDLPIWLDGLGTVAADQQVTVRPQVDGRIDKVLFTEGQAVKRGDVLVQLDPRPFLVALHQAQGALARDRAQLETLRTNLTRYEGLRTQNLVAGQQVEEIAGQVGQLEGAVRIDQAQIESAQLQLDYAQVKAPIDGITGLRQVDAGNIIRQTDPNGIVVITAIDPAAVFFTVPQDQLSNVTQAMARGDVPVEVFSRDGATRLAVGKLTVLDNQINQTTATLRLKALVPNPNRLLWPNAFVKARMLVETRKDAIVVPLVAIQRGPQGPYVYAVGPDKTAQMKLVTLALSTGDVAVIAKGLAGGEQVIVEGQNQVRAGGKVEPTQPGGPPAGAGSGQPGPRGKRDQADAERAPGSPAEPGRGQGSDRGSAAPIAPSSTERTIRPDGGHEADRPATGHSARSPGAGQDAPRPVSGQMVDRRAAEPSRRRDPATGPTAAGAAPAVP
jgi:multidrug efflux system membrane fusion protein